MCRALEELVESGVEKGKIAGIEEGRLKMLTEIIKKNLADHKTPEEIASVLYVDLSTVEEIIANIEKSA